MGNNLKVFLIERLSIGGYVISSEGSRSYLSAHHILEIGRFKNAVVFADLRLWGLLFLEEFVAPQCGHWKVTAYRLDIYTIWADGVLIKCSSAFGFLSLADAAEAAHHLQKILMSYASSSLTSGKVISRGSVGSALIQARCPSILEGGESFCGEGSRHFLHGGIICNFYNKRYSNLHFFDFPSMYGHIMAEGLFMGYQPAPRERGAGRLYSVYVGPYQKAPGRYIHDKGGWAFVFEEELDVFIKGGGRVIKLESAWSPRSRDSELAALVASLLKIRACGNKAAKLATNSIYGRLAVRDSCTETVVISRDDVKDLTGCDAIYRFGAGKYALMCRDEGEVYKPKKNIIAAAQVTSLCRARVNALAQKLTASGRCVVAVRTDAVYYTGEPLEGAYTGTLTNVSLGQNNMISDENGFGR